MENGSNPRADPPLRQGWPRRATPTIIAQLVLQGFVTYPSKRTPLWIGFFSRITAVKQTIKVALLIIFIATLVQAQGKGVDKQNERIRDGGSGTAPGSNGTKQTTGVGRGMDFGRDHSADIPLLPNPFRLSARRDAIVKAVADLMRDRKMIVDESASRPDEGLVISQPYTFIKGAVVSKSQLTRFADLPEVTGRDWTRGRYTISVVVQPIDGVASNVTVNAKIEGRTDGARGAEWTTLESTGMAEQEFLRALIENITGGLPAGSTSSAKPVWRGLLEDIIRGSLTP